VKRAIVALDFPAPSAVPDLVERLDGRPIASAEVPQKAAAAILKEIAAAR